MRHVVVGSGASGAMVALHLSSHGHQVLVLEAGRPFRPITRKVRHAEPLRRTGALGTERTITRIFPHMRTTRSGELVVVRGIGLGGCTALSCGSIVRTERGLREIGLDLNREFEEVGSKLSTCTVPKERWRPTTRRMFDVAERMGLRPEASRKAIDLERCVSCGMCELGCATGAKWDSGRWIEEAVSLGAEVLYGSEAQRVIAEDGKVTGVSVSGPKGTTLIRADTIILAAGGVGTAQVLQRSGVPVSDGLWIDPVITIGGVLKGARQLNEVPMSWHCFGKEHMISPYLDLLSHYFHPSWRGVSVKDRVGVMIKLADSANGRVDAEGLIEKALTQDDVERIVEATATVEAIMSEAGVKGPFQVGMINGGHLGGTFPLRSEDVKKMRSPSLPEGLWVADLSLVPSSQGSPTMMLAAALGLRVAKRIEDGLDHW